MQRVLIPLYYRPVDIDVGLCSTVTLHASPEEGTILLTGDNFAEMLDDLREHGAPRFHVFDTAAEAMAAEAMLGDDSRRSRGYGNDTEIGLMRDHEGVLMVTNDDRSINDDHFQIVDHRSPECKAFEVFGSWELPEAECREIMSPREPVSRMDLAGALARKLWGTPGDILRDTQVAIERMPGAYVGFVAVSPEEVRGDWRLEDIDPGALTDSEIQAQICRASSKTEMSDAFYGAVDAAVERLMVERSDLFPDETGPEPS